jgi:hypothetical protein
MERVTLIMDLVELALLIALGGLLGGVVLALALGWLPFV